MNSVVSWSLGIVMAAFGILSFYAASKAMDGIFYSVTLTFFAFSVFFIFVLIHNGAGQKSDH